MPHLPRGSRRDTNVCLRIFAMAPTAWCLLPLASLLPGVLGQVFVGSNGTATPMALPAAGILSTACNATFQTNITCDPGLLDIAYDGYFPTTEGLTQLCTLSCLDALSKLEALQQRDCSNQDVLSIDGEF